MDADRAPHVLLTIIKNTSPLDVTLPLLRAIRQRRPDVRVSVLYCVLNRARILRDGDFYSAALRRFGVKEYDLGDFLDVPGGPLVRGLFARSWYDERGLQFGDLRRRAARKAEHAITARAASPGRALAALDPDIVLYDNRTLTDVGGREGFYAYFHAARKPTYLLPHAPHHTGTTGFTPFNDIYDPLPDFAEYWMPFRYDRHWEALPEHKDQFVYVGYSGLDADWLAWLQAEGRALTGAAPASDGPLRCLFIIRKFLEEGQPRPPGHDPFIFDHDEFMNYLRLLAEAVKRSGAEIEVIVKPHPSNDYDAVARAFAKSGIPKWRITPESVYANLPHIDMAVSLYSTTLLIPAMAGVPTVLLHSRVQDVIHQWDEMRQMYTGLQFYLPDPADLPARFPAVVEAARARRANPVGHPGDDVQHLRRFFPNGATDRCYERLGLA
jgi:hypothetical protein